MSNNAADYSSARRSSVNNGAIVRDYRTVFPGFQIREDKVYGVRSKAYAIVLLYVILLALLPFLASFSIALRPLECQIYLVVSLATACLAIAYAIIKATESARTGVYAFDDKLVRTNYAFLAVDAAAIAALSVVMAACLLFAAGRLVESIEWVDSSQELASPPTGQQVDVVAKAICRKNGQIASEWRFSRDEHGNVLQVDETVSGYSERFELDANGYLETMSSYVEAFPRYLIRSETSGPSAHGIGQELDGETLKSYEARLEVRRWTPSLSGEFTYYADGRLQNETMWANVNVGGFVARYDEQGNVTNLTFGGYKLRKGGKPQLDFEYLRDDKGDVTGLATDVPFFDGRTSVEETRLVVETATDGAGNVLTASWGDMTWEFSYERVDDPSPSVLMSPRPLSTLIEVYFIDMLPVGSGYRPLPYSPAFPIALLVRESML